MAQGVKLAALCSFHVLRAPNFTSKWNQMAFAGDSESTIIRLNTQWLVVLCTCDAQATHKQVCSGKNHHMAGQSAKNPGNSSHATTNNTNSEGQFQPFRRLLRSHKPWITRMNGSGRRRLHLPEVWIQQTQFNSPKPATDDQKHDSPGRATRNLDDFGAAQAAQNNAYTTHLIDE